MLIKAEQKFIRMSSTKLRFVANSIRKMDPDRAIAYLEYLPKRAGAPLVKTIKQALANARNNLKLTGTFVIRELSVGEGPRYKRGMAASKGQYHLIVKKTAHIRVILETVEKRKESTDHGLQSTVNKKEKKAVVKK